MWVDDSMVKRYGNVDEFDCERRYKLNCLWSSVHNIIIVRGKPAAGAFAVFRRKMKNRGPIILCSSIHNNLFALNTANFMA